MGEISINNFLPFMKHVSVALLMLNLNSTSNKNRHGNDILCKSNMRCRYVANIIDNVYCVYEHLLYCFLCHLQRHYVVDVLLFTKRIYTFNKCIIRYCGCNMWTTMRLLMNLASLRSTMSLLLSENRVSTTYILRWIWVWLELKTLKTHFNRELSLNIYGPFFSNRKNSMIILQKINLSTPNSMLNTRNQFSEKISL